MYYLLAMAVSLCPQMINDENVEQNLYEKCGDRMFRIQKGDEDAFKELFKGCCPKFIIPAFAENAEEQNSKMALEFQLNIFLKEVKQQELIWTIRSYLKLYSTISISKLAGFLHVDEIALRTFLCRYKHKTRNWVNKEWVSSSDVEFYVDKEMIHVADYKVPKKYGEYFLNHINKFEDVVNNIQRVEVKL